MKDSIHTQFNRDLDKGQTEVSGTIFLPFSDEDGISFRATADFEDVGIGPYEFWGATYNDTRMAWVVQDWVIDYSQELTQDQINQVDVIIERWFDENEVDTFIEY